MVTHTYIVNFQTESNTDVLLVTSSLEEAFKEYDTFYPDCEFWHQNGMSVEIVKQTQEMTFIANLEEDETIEDYLDCLDDEGLWEVKNEDFEVIESRSIPPINEKSDELMRDVQTHFGGKYTKHNGVALRIADHSLNPENIYRHENRDCQAYLSVVIANADVTERFVEALTRRQRQLKFDDSQSAQEIIETVKETINEMLES